MKDVFDVKRSADSDDVLKQLNGQFFKVMNVSADTELEDVDSGAIICADFSTDGTDITLPKRLILIKRNNKLTNLKI